MATKTLRVTLADILGVAGPAGRVHGEVWARFVDGNGAPREVRYTDGTLVTLAAPRVPLNASGYADFVVVPNDDASVQAADQGFGIQVGWDLTIRGPRGAVQNITNSGKTVAITSASPSPAQFGLLATYTPIIAGTSYITQSTADAAYGRKFQINVKEYGATGNGTTDDTTAVQNAINAAYAAASTEVYFPPGTYKITTALLLPAAIRMRGAAAVNDVYSSLGKSSRIDSYGAELFKSNPAAPGTPVSYVSMSDLFISNKVATQTGTALFRDMTLRGAQIERIAVDNFGTIFDGPTAGVAMNFVSLVKGCHFMGIWDAFNSGSIMDSTIEGNYINGRPLTNATCFDVNGWAMVTVANNYCDYFKYVFKLSGSHSTIMATGNRFDVCFRAIYSATSPRALDRSTFTSNVFRFMRSTDISNFTNADAEMIAGPWVAVECRGSVECSFTGNVFDRVDTAFRFRDYPHMNLKLKGNTFQQVTTQVDWSVTKSATTGDLTGIDIDAMNDTRVTSLPSAGLTGGSVTTFDRHRLIFNGVPVYNDSGVWRKQDGLNAALLATKTANYSIGATEGFVVFNGTSLTASLPDPTTVVPGVTFIVKNINASSLTVNSQGTSKTLDGAASQSLAQWAKAAYVSDGTQWLTV